MTDKIRILNKIPCNTVSHVLFDFDGTIATVREGWERVMGPYMIGVLSLAGDAMAEMKVNEYVNLSAGVQTIFQMEWLANEVAKQGKTPLYVLDYKNEYVRRLIEMADHRISRVEMGDIDKDELMIVGARQFLQHAHSIDMAMYIASGTDQECVRRDAKVLDIDHFFEDNIFGAGEPGYSKKKIIEEILSSWDIDGACLAVFGDGPVEIREAKAAGAIGIGVAVDEVKRQGWDETKVERLTEAGADILIPDFSDTSRLIKLLWG